MPLRIARRVASNFIRVLLYAGGGIWLGTIAGVIVAVIAHLLGLVPGLQTANMTAAGWIVLGAAGVGLVAGAVTALKTPLRSD